MKRFFLYVLILSSSCAWGQNMQIYPTINGLKEFDVPAVFSREWSVFNHNILENYSIDGNGNVTIYPGHRPQTHRYKTNDGVLTGTNRGEWGGELTFKNDAIEYRVLTANICGIVNYNNEIFVLTGLSHMRIFNGKIFKIENINGRWESTFSVEFNNSPEAYTIFENKLYIVTFDGLIVFDGNGIQQLLTEQFWEKFIPKFNIC